MRTVQSSATLTGWKRYERSGSILQLPHRRTMTRLSDHYIPFGLAARAAPRLEIIVLKPKETSNTVGTGVASVRIDSCSNIEGVLAEDVERERGNPGSDRTRP